jgi:hypothetical protein
MFLGSINIKLNGINGQQNESKTTWKSGSFQHVGNEEAAAAADNVSEKRERENDDDDENTPSKDEPKLKQSKQSSPTKRSVFLKCSNMSAYI